MSSCSLAVLQFGALWPGVGEGAGVGGDAGAEGNRLPGMTLGLAGMGMGIEGAPREEEFDWITRGGMPMPEAVVEVYFWVVVDEDVDVYFWWLFA